MKLAPYPEYKDSGVPWLGKIPAHWELHRGKWLFRKMERPVRSQDEVVTCFRDGTVTLRKNRRIRGFTESLKEIGYQGIRKGDLVIHQMDAFAGAVGVSDSDGKGTPVYSVCLPKRDLDTHYYAQLVREMSRSYFITSLAKGIRERSTDFRFDTFASLTLPVPLPEEQKAISRFMRNESAQINKFIRNKRRLIELLKEQKQNVINQAVTRGLDPKVKFKPSGVEWIGDIPEHWEVRRLKFLCHNLNEQTSEKQPGETYIALEHVESWTGRISLPDDEITFDSQVKRFQPGDVLFGKLRPYLAKVTRPQTAGVCVGEFLVLRATGDVSADFLEQKLRSKRVIDLINSSTFGAKMPRADWTFIGNLKFAYPPADEQREILEHIQEKSAEIDQAIIRAQREIELMREYRTRLISDVVTGQVDVRNVKCEGGSLNEDEFEDIEEVEEEIELPEGGEDDE
ncbi:MAG: restriction endonuclease subunit S [Kiritimatiellia bacterium]|jgi:type I restriction enzyme S subunit